jgi:hypothetical protein
LPVGMFLVGMLIGSFRIGTGYFFTQSLFLLGLIILVGGLGAFFGFCLSLGYAMGDFIFFRSLASLFSANIVSDLLFGRVSALLQYALFIALAAGVPVFVTLLCHQTWNQPEDKKTRSEWAPYLRRGAISALLVYLWTLSGPTVVIAIFRWAHSLPDADAIMTVSRNRWLLVSEALVVGALRVYLEKTAAATPGTRNRLIQYADTLRQSKRIVIETPPWLRSVLKAATMTILLSALYTFWWQGLIFFLAIVTAFTARSRGVLRTDWTEQMVARTGLIQRLVLGALLTYATGFLSLMLARSTHSSMIGFLIMLIACVACITVMTVFLPFSVRASGEFPTPHRSSLT